MDGTITIKLQKSKVTPGTVRFDAPKVEGAPRPAVRDVYVTKEALGGKEPAAIEVTIKAL